jgi:hypothetical protein
LARIEKQHRRARCAARRDAWRLDADAANQWPSTRWMKANPMRITALLLDEHVVAPGAAAVDADRDFLAVQDGGERHAGKLPALIGVEDLRRPETRHRFL